MVENEKVGLVSDSYSIGSVWTNYFSQLLNVHGVNDIRHTEIHTAEPLVPEPSAFEFELAIEKPKSHKSPGIDQIPAGDRTIFCEIHKLIISVWKEELPEEWKEFIIVPICKKGNKTDYSNYRGISLLPTTYKILSNILLSRLAEEIIGDHLCGLQRNRSAADHIFCIRQMLKKKWEYNEALHQLFYRLQES